MAVESWIDALCARWEISDGRGGSVHSYRVYEKAEFPESIAVYPCALTYTDELDVRYDAGFQVGLWSGVTEFHLTSSTDKSNFPAIMLYFQRILAAAVGDITLGGRVAHFLLRNGSTGGPGIVGPRVLQYGSEAPHLCLLVYWRVKELFSLTIA